MAFHKNNQPTHNFPSGSSPKRTDEETVQSIEKNNFNLRQQVENMNRAINALKENFSKQQKELADTRAKNQILETKSVAQEAELKKSRSLFVNACKKRDPHALNKKVKEINEQLQATEEQLNTVKNENHKLKRKLSDDHAEYEKDIKAKRLKLSEKCSKIFQLKTDLKNEQQKCTTQTDELANVQETLETTKKTVTELEGNRDSQITLIKTQNDCIRDLKSQVSLLKPALEDKEKLQQSLGEAKKITQGLEQAIQNCKSKTKKIQSRNYLLTAKLQRKQTELDGNLLERNHLFKFAQDVGILLQLPLYNSSPLQDQLPGLLAHLKETLRVGGCIFQYQQQNQQPSTLPARSATSPPPPPQQPSTGEDEGDQLYDEFTSQSMMNIHFPLPSSSPQHSTSNINGPTPTVQTVSILPQQSIKAVETTANASYSQDALFREIMSDVHQSVTHIKPKTKPKKVRAKRAVITQTKKHEEDLEKRKKGRSANCEGGAKYFCVCGSVETSYQRLKIHMIQLNRDKKFECEKCPNRFAYFGRLRYHLATIHHMPHALDEFVTGCILCGEMFKNREQFRQHQISAHIDSTFTNPAVVANDGDDDIIEIPIVSISNEMKTIPSTSKMPQPLTSIVTAAPQQPNNVSRRVPSVCIDLEDEEVDVEA